MGEAIYELYFRPGSGSRSCLLCKKPVETEIQAFLLKMSLNALGLIKIPKSEEIHEPCGLDLATAIRKKKAVNASYKLKLKKASGKKECLLCDEKIPAGAEVWNLEIGVQVMGVVEVPKNEEIHLGCGEDFSFKLEAVAKDVR